jgi:hypothetical protein
MAQKGEIMMADEDKDEMEPDVSLEQYEAHVGPQPQGDYTPAADPFVQQLVAENARLRRERDEWMERALAAEQKLKGE